MASGIWVSESSPIRTIVITVSNWHYLVNFRSLPFEYFICYNIAYRGWRMSYGFQPMDEESIRKVEQELAYKEALHSGRVSYRFKPEDKEGIRKVEQQLATFREALHRERGKKDLAPQFKKILIDQLQEYNKYNLVIDTDARVMRDMKFALGEDNRLKWIFDFAEIDLCLGKKHEPFTKIAGEMMKESNIHFRYGSREYTDILIPFVILELNSGEITIESIRSRSVVVSEVKSKFPFVSYIFIAEDTGWMPQTLDKTSYSNILIYNYKLTDEGIEEIVEEYIKPHVAQLERDGLLTSF